MVAGLALYAVMVAWGDASAVRDSAAQLGLGGWLFVLGLSLVNYALRYLRWHFYITRQGYRLAAAANLLYYTAGFAFITTPVKAGEVIRAWYLKERHQVGYAHSLAALFTDRLMDLTAVLLLALTSALAFPSYHWLVTGLGVLLLIALPLIHSASLRRLIHWFSQLLPWTKARALGGHLITMLQSASLLLGTTNLYIGLALSTLAWAAEGIGFWWICQALGIPLDPFTALAVYALGMLAGAASLIPGGLGSTETVMGLLLVSLGADTPTAIAATLICRIATLWFAVALGFIAISLLESKASR